MKRSEVDVGRLLIAHCCKKFASHVGTETRMPCDPLFVSTRCFAVDVAEYVLYKQCCVVVLGNDFVFVLSVVDS